MNRKYLIIALAVVTIIVVVLMLALIRIHNKSLIMIEPAPSIGERLDTYQEKHNKSEIDWNEFKTFIGAKRIAVINKKPDSLKFLLIMEHDSIIPAEAIYYNVNKEFRFLLADSLGLNCKNCRVKFEYPFPIKEQVLNAIRNHYSLSKLFPNSNFYSLNDNPDSLEFILFSEGSKGKWIIHHRMNITDFYYNTDYYKKQ